MVEAGQPDTEMLDWQPDLRTKVLEPSSGSPPGGAGGSAYQIVYPYQNIIAITNPIFVDVDGNGTFDAPDR